MNIRRKRPLKYISKLTKIIKENKYNIVHVHGSSSIMFLELYAAKMAGVKIRIAHSHNTKTEHPIIHKILYPYFKKSYNVAFACGKDAGEWLFKNEDFYIIPNAQNVEKFKFDKKRREEYRKKYNLEDSIVLGHVGGFNYQKNHEFLIDVFKRINTKDKKYKLVLIGEGKLMNEIREKVHKLRLDENVIFVGKSTVVNEWLNAMDIMLLPSRYEGLPNVLIEWQISGLYCFVSNVVTTEAKITDLVQYLSFDSELWVNEILKVSDNICKNRNKKENIEKILKAGYEIIDSSSNLHEKYKSLSEKIVEEKNG